MNEQRILVVIDTLLDEYPALPTQELVEMCARIISVKDGIEEGDAISQVWEVFK